MRDIQIIRVYANANWNDSVYNTSKCNFNDFNISLFIILIILIMFFDTLKRISRFKFMTTKITMQNTYHFTHLDLFAN